MLWMGKIYQDFQVEEKKCKNQEKLKVLRRCMPDRGKCFSMGLATQSGPVAVEDEGLDAAARTLMDVNGEKKEE